MQILFDHNLPRKLKNHLSPHQITLTVKAGWDDLENGELLAAAQDRFEILLTVDNNIYHQQKVALYDIAVIVLRAYDNSYETLQPLMPSLLDLLDAIKPGNVYYLYIDDKLKETDRRKGKGPEADRIQP